MSPPYYSILLGWDKARLSGGLSGVSLDVEAALLGGPSMPGYSGLMGRRRWGTKDTACAKQISAVMFSWTRHVCTLAWIYSR
jgi:hypothetical protein